jgi:hypothetical protein
VKRDCKFKQLNVVEEAEGMSTIPMADTYILLTVIRMFAKKTEV